MVTFGTECGKHESVSWATQFHLYLRSGPSQISVFPLREKESPPARTTPSIRSSHTLISIPEGEMRYATSAAGVHLQIFCRYLHQFISLARFFATSLDSAQGSSILWQQIFDFEPFIFVDSRCPPPLLWQNKSNGYAVWSRCNQSSQLRH